MEEGAHNSLDELGFPAGTSDFDISTPRSPKFHIELFGVADAKYHRLITIQLCEGSQRFVDLHGRYAAGHPYYSPQFTSEEWKRVEEKGWGLMDMKVFKMLTCLPKGAMVAMDSRFASLPNMVRVEKELGIGIVAT